MNSGVWVSAEVLLVMVVVSTQGITATGVARPNTMTTQDQPGSLWLCFRFHCPFSLGHYVKSLHPARVTMLVTGSHVLEGCGIPCSGGEECDRIPGDADLLPSSFLCRTRP